MEAYERKIKAFRPIFRLLWALKTGFSFQNGEGRRLKGNPGSELSVWSMNGPRGNLLVAGRNAAPRSRRNGANFRLAAP